MKLLQKRSEKLLHGMWQFPMFESEDARREITKKSDMTFNQ